MWCDYIYSYANFMTKIINMICLSIFNIAPANSSSDSINEEVICSNGISNDNSSGDSDGAVTALAVLFSIAVIVLVISAGINITLFVKLKQLRCVVTN